MTPTSSTFFPSMKKIHLSSTISGTTVFIKCQTPYSLAMFPYIVPTYNNNGYLEP
jgi:hypothetical protein